jgi:hypothetical protein
MNRVSAPTRAPLSRVGAGAAFLACLAGGSPAALADNCEAHRLGSLLGKPYSQERAAGVSKADTIRTLTLGKTVVTAEYQSDRLNIFVDLKRIVVRAECG